MLGECAAGHRCEFPHPPFDTTGDWQPLPPDQTKAVLWQGAPVWPAQPAPPAAQPWTPLSGLPGPAGLTAAAPAAAAGGEGEGELDELLQVGGWGSGDGWLLSGGL